MTFNWFNETLLYVVIWTNNEENAKFFTDTSSKVMTSSLPVSYNLHAKHRVFEMTTERGWLYSRSFFETHPVHVSSPFLRNSLGHLPSLINIKTDREREISSRLWMQTRPIESDNINTKKMISSIRKTVYIDRGRGLSLCRVENCFHSNNNLFMEENGHLLLKFPSTYAEEREREREKNEIIVAL